jgi:hypothetical protein
VPEMTGHMTNVYKKQGTPVKNEYIIILAKTVERERLWDTIKD